MTEQITELANAAIDARYTRQHETELHTADGGVYVGRDRADIIANLQLRNHLVRRRLRGRDPFWAELLGFFEGAAAWKRGHTYDRLVVKMNGVELVDGDGAEQTS